MSDTIAPVRHPRRRPRKRVNTPYNILDHEWKPEEAFDANERYKKEFARWSAVKVTNQDRPEVVSFAQHRIAKAKEHLNDDIPVIDARTIRSRGICQRDIIRLERAIVEGAAARVVLSLANVLGESMSEFVNDRWHYSRATKDYAILEARNNAARCIKDAQTRPLWLLV